MPDLPTIHRPFMRGTHGAPIEAAHLNALGRGLRVTRHASVNTQVSVEAARSEWDDGNSVHIDFVSTNITPGVSGARYILLATGGLETGAPGGGFEEHKVPLALVTTDGGGVVTALADEREARVRQRISYAFETISGAPLLNKIARLALPRAGAYVAWAMHLGTGPDVGTSVIVGLRRAGSEFTTAGQNRPTVTHPDTLDNALAASPTAVVQPGMLEAIVLDDGGGIADNLQISIEFVF